MVRPGIGLSDPIRGLPGAGPVTAARLAARGLARVGDLLTFFPRGYDDYRRTYRASELAGAPAGTPVVVRGTVARVQRFFRRLLTVEVEDGAGRLRARWFHPNPGMAKAYARGTEVVLAGKLQHGKDGLPELIHPSNVGSVWDAAGGAGIRPRYPLVDKVPGRIIAKLIDVALEVAGGDCPEILPEELRRRLGLPPAARAFVELHRPRASLTEVELDALAMGTSASQRRFAFEELFVLQLALLRERAGMRRAPGFPCGGDLERGLREAAAALPFVPTDAQGRAARSLAGAMAAGPPMQCLLHGEVGSGKTAVVFAACHLVARAGGQSLLMAPTAVLAGQHHRTLGAFGARVGMRVGLLHSGLPASEQRRAREAAAAGELDLLIGTHALLDEKLRLARLGLAVVDEQHRFGVRQRAALRRAKGGENGWQTGTASGMVPHLLVLSATPIPRSLALTIYGDLDLVTLDALPPGREPVRTRLCRGGADRDEAYRALAHAVAEGGQGFVICPGVAETAATSRTSVVSLARSLRPKLAPARLGVLHGQLAPERQQAVAEAFQRGELDVLVATTVVEVGVDVPTARVAIVEDAERFGLAQLHQLRGRVGRGQGQGQCFLVTGSEDPGALERLSFVAEVTDGFRIAEEDLRRRGAGDVHGTRQTGLPELRFADPGLYLGLLDSARREAEAVLAADPGLVHPEHAALAEAVRERVERGGPVAEEAG